MGASLGATPMGGIGNGRGVDVSGAAGGAVLISGDLPSSVDAPEGDGGEGAGEAGSVSATSRGDAAGPATAVPDFDGNALAIDVCAARVIDTILGHTAM